MGKVKSKLLDDEEKDLPLSDHPSDGANDAHGLDDAPNTVWDFVVKFYPGYSYSTEIAYSGDLDKLLNAEYDDGDSAHQLLIKEFNNDIMNPDIQITATLVLANIYEQAIQQFLTELAVITKAAGEHNDNN